MHQDLTSQNLSGPWYSNQDSEWPSIQDAHVGVYRWQWFYWTISKCQRELLFMYCFQLICKVSPKDQQENSWRVMILSNHSCTTHAWQWASCRARNSCIGSWLKSSEGSADCTSKANTSGLVNCLSSVVWCASKTLTKKKQINSHVYFIFFQWIYQPSMTLTVLQHLSRAWGAVASHRDAWATKGAREASVHWELRLWAPQPTPHHLTSHPSDFEWRKTWWFNMLLWYSKCNMSLWFLFACFLSVPQVGVLLTTSTASTYISLDLGHYSEN